MNEPPAPPPAPRVTRSRADLEAALVEQIDMLQMSCGNYDAGKHEAAKYIALTLRVLLHETSKSHALLAQLDLLGGKFISSASPNTHLEGITYAVSLAGAAIGPRGGTHLPICLMPTSDFYRRPMDFADWWKEVVVILNKATKFTRRDIVLEVANTDGGGHVDPTLKTAYEAYSRRNLQGWWFSDGNGVRELDGKPHLATVRQIAFEVLETLKANAPDSVRR